MATNMGKIKMIMMVCMIILVVVGTTTMASKPFPFDDKPDEVCCYPGYPCCDVPFPPGEEDEEGALEAVAPSPSMAHGQKNKP
ncbi:hypothetical protein QVD17_35412 [Tagetes erecta]|uniref:Uncharacterized protein n=1 Tax=Tagetes erecta TaxID=13708 RepID=A0AAD8K3E7_TARER|nr:hypothetical protein QVD17_35412 [Tagetes erecta]